MISLEQYKKEFEALGVAGIYLFGSYAQGVAGALSDVDLGILLENPRFLGNHEERNKLYDALYDIFSKESAKELKRLCNIDIVFLQDPTINLQLKYHVAAYGKPLFEKDRRIFADFKERVMESYADFAPLRRIFTRAILARI